MSSIYESPQSNLGDSGVLDRPVTIKAVVALFAIHAIFKVVYILLDIDAHIATEMAVKVGAYLGILQGIVVGFLIWLGYKFARSIFIVFWVLGVIGSFFSMYMVSQMNVDVSPLPSIVAVLNSIAIDLPFVALLFSKQSSEWLEAKGITSQSAPTR